MQKAPAANKQSACDNTFLVICVFERIPKIETSPILFISSFSLMAPLITSMFLKPFF